MHTGRAFERLISFTDAVVAVAITLLILPIIDIRGDSQEDSVWQVISDNSSEFITFGFTFLVVGIMWRTHNRMMNSLKGYDEFIFWVNLFWLMAVVFLPWASALYGEGVGVATNFVNNPFDTGGSGTLYWLTLATISGLGSLIIWHANRKPELREDPEHTSMLGVYRGLTFVGAFVLLAILSLVAPTLASWLPMLLIPISIWNNRVATKRNEPGDDTA